MTPLDAIRIFVELSGMDSAEEEQDENIVNINLERNVLPEKYNGYSGFMYKLEFDKKTGQLLKHGGWE
jgi:hypothetical protein